MTTKSLHVRRLAPFGPDLNAWIDEQLNETNNVFKANTDIDFAIASNKFKPFNSGIVRIDECSMGGPSTADQNILFAGTQDVPQSPDDIVVFIVVDFEGWKGGGCAWHPPNRLGCMVTEGKLGAHQWKLAHELGHALGLFHNDQSTKLMYPSVMWNSAPPLLQKLEAAFLDGRGPAPNAGGDGSLGLSDEEFRFELSRIEPRYRQFSVYNERAIDLLKRIYLTTDDAEIRARAVFAISRIARRYADYDDVLDRAALNSGPEGVKERRSAAEAAGRLLPQEPAARILQRLLNDDDESVRLFAGRQLEKEHKNR
jgi:hypothetical protein